jgi:hypothetical protein
VKLPHFFARPVAQDVFLGTSAVAVAPSGQPPRWQPLPAGADPVATLLQHAKEAQLPTLNVWLSAAFARPFMAGPLAGLRRWSEVQAVLAAMADEATGLQGPCTVWAAGPVHRHAGLAVAVPAALLDHLHQQAQAQGLRVQSVRPWWSVAFNAALLHAPQARLVVVDDGEALTSLQALPDPDATGSAVSAASTHWPAPDAQQRAGWLARQTAAHNLSSQEVCVVQMARVQAADDAQQELPAVPLGAAVRAEPWPVSAVMQEAGA